MQSSFEFGLPLREHQLRLNLSSKHHVGPTLDPLKNRNIGLIYLKMSVVTVWISVCVSVKYLSIRININKMPAV